MMIESLWFSLFEFLEKVAQFVNLRDQLFCRKTGCFYTKHAVYILQIHVPGYSFFLKKLSHQFPSGFGIDISFEN